MDNREDFDRTLILGIRMSRVEYESVAQFVLTKARHRQPGTVSALAVHGVMTGVSDAEHRARLNSFDVLAPDGQPVRWAMNLMRPKDRLRDRVYGPDLTKILCEAASSQGVGVYFYGSTPHVIESLAQQLSEWYETLKIVGMRPSRFRDPTPEEDADDVADINSSGAGIVFVGLGCPRQEKWAWEHRDRIQSVLVCVGAAFDFHAGTVPQAPKWMQRIGMEWFFRLVREPRRLWRRYMILNPLYVILLLFQWLGIWTPAEGDSRPPRCEGDRSPPQDAERGT